MFGKKFQPADSSDDYALDIQSAAQDLGDAYLEHDTKRLASLTSEERAKQTQARWELFRHIDAIWDAPQLRSQGIHPNEAGGYESVAGMRDLLMALWGNAQEAQEQAGDDVDAVTVDIVVRSVDDD